MKKYYTYEEARAENNFGEIKIKWDKSLQRYVFYSGGLPRGRPPIPPEARSKKRGYSIRILPTSADELKRIGSGSISRGIESVLDWFKYK
jgi:hypothetical protein